MILHSGGSEWKSFISRLRREIMLVNIVLINRDKEENTEYIFSFWYIKVDIPGLQRAARPLSRHIAGAAILSHAL